MEVSEGKTILTVPHRGGKLSFQHPAYRGAYGNVAEQISADGLRRPNSGETASLVYDAFQNPNEQYQKGIINTLKSNWYWEFTGNLYLPKSNEDINNGVILENNPSIVNRNWVMDKKSLIESLQKGDEDVTFVPFGFKVGEQTSRELEKNAYIIARYGEEGAQKIAEIADKFKYNPKLWSFKSVDEETTRASALNRGWYLDDGLFVGGDSWGGLEGGLSFGELASDKK